MQDDMVALVGEGVGMAKQVTVVHAMLASLRGMTLLLFIKLRVRQDLNPKP